MRFKPSVLATISFAFLAVATPLRRDQCDTGSLQCCQSVQEADSPAASKILALLGITVQDVTALVGVTCSPITVVGAGTTSWSVFPPLCVSLAVID